MLLRDPEKHGQYGSLLPLVYESHINVLRSAFHVCTGNSGTGLHVSVFLQHEYPKRHIFFSSHVMNKNKIKFLLYMKKYSN